MEGTYIYTSVGEKILFQRTGGTLRVLRLVAYASNASLDFPAPKVPDGASIMEQFRILELCRAEIPETYRYDQHDPARWHATRAGGFYWRRQGRCPVGLEHRRQ